MKRGIFVRHRIVPETKKLGFVCDRTSYIRVLKYRWCSVIILIASTQTEEKSNNGKGTFYDELEKVLSHFLSII